MRRLGVSCAVATLVVGMIASAAPGASGWAGSRYERSDCNQIRTASRPGLFCQRWFSSTAQATTTTLFADETCASGLRAVERSGTLETRFRGFDIYAGPSPLAKFNTGGDNLDFVDTWTNYTDTDRGCV